MSRFTRSSSTFTRSRNKNSFGWHSRTRLGCSRDCRIIEAAQDCTPRDAACRVVSDLRESFFEGARISPRRSALGGHPELGRGEISASESRDLHSELQRELPGEGTELQLLSHQKRVQAV